MKYNININQLALSETELDLIDSAILDYLYFYCNSKSEEIEKQRVDGFTWVDYKNLLRDMPLLRIKSSHSLSPRIKRIEKAGFIETKIIRKSGHRRLIVKMTRLVDSLIVKTITPNRENEKPNRETYLYNNTKDNNTKDYVSSKEERETKVSYGNPDINSLISLLKENNHGIIDGSEKENRRYCWLMLQKFAYKDDPRKAKNGAEFVIKKALQSDFHSKNATNFKYLYKHASSIVADYRQNTIKNQIIKI